MGERIQQRTTGPVVTSAPALWRDVYIFWVVQLPKFRVFYCCDDAWLQIDQDGARDVMRVIGLSAQRRTAAFNKSDKKSDIDCPRKTEKYLIEKYILAVIARDGIILQYTLAVDHIF